VDGVIKIIRSVPMLAGLATVTTDLALTNHAPSYFAIITAVVAIAGIIWTYFGGIMSIRKDMVLRDEAARKETSDLATQVRKETTDLATQVRKETTELATQVRKEINDHFSVFRQEVSSLENRLTKSETKMELFWKSVGGVVSTIIKQPIHFEKDELMDKLTGKRDTMSSKELYRLREILTDEIGEFTAVKDPKAMAYALALAYIEQILFDRLDGRVEVLESTVADLKEKAKCQTTLSV
jgi:hypothetical protein